MLEDLGINLIVCVLFCVDMPNYFEETVENASDVYILIIKCLQTIYYYVLHHVVLVISTWKQTYYSSVFPTWRGVNLLWYVPFSA